MNTTRKVFKDVNREDVKELVKLLFATAREKGYDDVTTAVACQLMVHSLKATRGIQVMIGMPSEKEANEGQ